jgi:hypothetical protein
MTMIWRRVASRHKISSNAIFLAAVLAGPLAATASAQTLVPDVTVKAKVFKAADASYLRVLCDGSHSDRDEARAARAHAEDDLEKAINDAAAQAPDVRKALDGAADAGETAEKVAASPSASDRDKSEAQDKFKVAKTDLRDALAKERKRIEAQISQDFSVKFEPATDCPDRPKAVERRRSPPAKFVHARRETVAPAARERSSPASAAPAPASGFSFGVGGGGIGVSVGR